MGIQGLGSCGFRSTVVDAAIRHRLRVSTAMSHPPWLLFNAGVPHAEAGNRRLTVAPLPLRQCSTQAGYLFAPVVVAVKYRGMSGLPSHA